MCSVMPYPLKSVISMQSDGSSTGRHNVRAGEFAGAIAPDAEAGIAGDLGARLGHVRDEFEEVDVLDDRRRQRREQEQHERRERQQRGQPAEDHREGGRGWVVRRS
jgi:hypothetical protein